jgi:hypothetical protein
VSRRAREFDARCLALELAVESLGSLAASHVELTVDLADKFFYYLVEGRRGAD